MKEQKSLQSVCFKIKFRGISIFWRQKTIKAKRLQLIKIPEKLDY